MQPPRWKIIAHSPHEWERRGLDFIRTGLNFEFQTSDGAIYEVDLLVLTKMGFWLVESKAWEGRIYGDAGTWTISHDGRLHSEDNPVLLANRKAKALISLLKAQSAVSKIKMPWLDALVFLSADKLQCDLTGPARNRVCLKDPEGSLGSRQPGGILEALINRVGFGVSPDLHNPIDTRVMKAIDRAMDQAGILFDALRAEAEELEIDWSTIENADGMDRHGTDWDNLLQLVARVATKLTEELASRTDHLLLVHPGLISRYDQMQIVETLRDKVGHDVPCPDLWLLVATDGQNDMPKLDNAEIPLITTGQRAKVSEAWIDNVHRGRAEPVAAVAGVGRKGGN